MINFKKIVAKYLREVADKIDSDNCELSESEAMDILQVIAHEPLSKEQACDYLNLRRSRFDDLVKANVIPKGKKIKGYKELRWYKNELDIVKWKNK